MVHVVPMGAQGGGPQGPTPCKFQTSPDPEVQQSSYLVSYTGWPRKNGTVDTVDFQDIALINSYFFHFVG